MNLIARRTRPDGARARRWRCSPAGSSEYRCSPSGLSGERVFQTGTRRSCTIRRRPNWLAQVELRLRHNGFSRLTTVPRKLQGGHLHDHQPRKPGQHHTSRSALTTAAGAGNVMLGVPVLNTGASLLATSVLASKNAPAERQVTCDK
jgi:hypothetical protein